MTGGILCRVLLLTTTCVVAVAATGAAQTVRIGDKVQMIDSRGRETAGTVRGVEMTALTVAVDGIEERWTVATMRELWREGDSLRNGLGIGALVGAGGGILLGAALVAAGEVGDPSDILARRTMLGVGIGAAAGAGIDFLIRGRTLIYRQGSARLTISPVVTPDTKAVRFAFRF